MQFIYLVSPLLKTLPKLIPTGTKIQNNKQKPQAAINWTKSTKETGTTPMMPLLFTLNIFYILPDVKYAKRRAFYWKKRLTGCKGNWFTSSPVYTPPPPPSKYRPIKFVLYLYIRPGHINKILQWLALE